MNVETFLAELDASVASALDRIAQAAARPGAPGDATSTMGVKELLATALKKELEAAEEAAFWLVSETDLDVKLALVRQCGDEGRHYRLIEAHLQKLGVDTTLLTPLAGGPSPMFEFLKSLETTVERVAAGQFTREALALVQNRVFIDYCRAHGDEETARLYEDVIQPDERHHHEMGRRLVARLASTDEAQALARKASSRTLEIAEELQSIARLKRGIACAPGC